MNKQKTVKSPFPIKLKREQFPVRFCRVGRKREISEVHYVFMLKQSFAARKVRQMLQAIKFSHGIFGWQQGKVMDQDCWGL